MNLSDITHTNCQPPRIVILNFRQPILNSQNQAQVRANYMFKPMKYMKELPESGDLCGVLNAGLVETLSLVLRTHVFTSTLLYFSQ